MDSRFLEGSRCLCTRSVVVNAENQGSIALLKILVFHDRSEHIDIQYPYARELIRNGRITPNHVPTADMLADLLTKSLPCIHMYAQLAARGVLEILACDARRTVRVCSLFTWTLDLYILRTPLTASRLSCFPEH
jgi:hypothetical protein